VAIKIVEVTDIDMAFGSVAEEIMPPLQKIPEEFRSMSSPARTPYNELFRDWFYSGIRGLKVVPKPGVNPDKALRMIRCILGSYMPAHEHKEAAVAYMFSEFFDRIEYASLTAPEKVIVITNRRKSR
jgi:hypothetical protein